MIIRSIGNINVFTGNALDLTMSQPLSDSKKYIYFGLIVISLGVIYNTTLTDTVGSIGMLFMALGGLFFIVGMRKRKQEEQNNQEDNE